MQVKSLTKLNKNKMWTKCRQNKIKLANMKKWTESGQAVQIKARKMWKNVNKEIAKHEDMDRKWTAKRCTNRGQKKYGQKFSLAVMCRQIVLKEWTKCGHKIHKVSVHEKVDKKWKEKE